MAKVCDGGGYDGVVEEGLVAGVGDGEGGVEELAGEARQAAAGTEEELGGGFGEEAPGAVLAAQARADYAEAGPGFAAEAARLVGAGTRR